MYGGESFRADADQMGAVARDFAPALAGMFHGLVAEGVPPEVAGQMASDFFGRLIAAQGSKQ